MRSEPSDRADVRRLRPRDYGQYLDFLLDLDETTRRNRFAGCVSDDLIADHVDRLAERDATVFGAFITPPDAARPVMIGGAEWHPTQAMGTGEAAFAVDPRYRKRGVGALLLDAIVLHARNRGSREIRVVCLRDNMAMRRLATRAEARLMITLDEIEGTIAPPPPSPLSYWREWWSDRRPSAWRARVAAH